MSKVVFVGNVPYNMGESDLIDVFKSVGQVVGFRLVFDRDTGKAKGYGFCEFSDHETALSAVRNLNNQDVGGRPLRIDIADSDPFLEGKTTVRGEILDGGYPGPAEPRTGWRGGGRSDPEAFMANLPPGKPIHGSISSLDSITATLANMPPNQLLEVLAQMKAFIITHPDQARILLQKQPQFSYALFQALLLHKIVPVELLTKMQNTSTPAPSVPDHHKRGLRGAPLPQQAYPPPPPHAQQPPPQAPPPAPHNMYMQPPPTYPAAPAAPPVVNMYAQPPPVMPPQAPGGYYNRPPPPPMQAPPVQQQAPPVAPAQQQPAGAGDVSESQREMVMQLLNLSPETINTLPPEQKAGILALRQQFMGMNQ